MERFKPKSIDEFDREFVENIRVSLERKSKIPEIIKEPPSNKTDFPPDPGYLKNSAQTSAVSPEYLPKGDATALKKGRPLTPAGQNSASYNPAGAVPYKAAKEDFDFSKGDYGRVRAEPDGKKKSGKGALAVKIISIIMLVSSVFVFLSGCFISIFLDNSPLGKTYLNTLSQDIESLGVSKGDLIVSKRVAIDEYSRDSFVAVPDPSGAGCDVRAISLVDPVSEDDAELTTVEIANGTGVENSLRASDCYGIVRSYVPALGGVMTFAMDNAVLVCVLFVLIAAFWSLILALVERSSKLQKPKKKKKAKN